MPFQSWSDGLYLAKTDSLKVGGLVQHYGIIDIGNCFEFSQSNGEMPLVYHMTSEGLRIDWLSDTGCGGNPTDWEITDEIVDVEYAKGRLLEASENPDYDLFGNNCEHFANYIATGMRSSGQLRGVVIIGAVVFVLSRLFKK